MYAHSRERRHAHPHTLAHGCTHTGVHTRMQAREHRCMRAQPHWPLRGRAYLGLSTRSPAPHSLDTGPHTLELTLDVPLSQWWADRKQAARTGMLCPLRQAALLTTSSVAWPAQNGPPGTGPQAGPVPVGGGFTLLVRSSPTTEWAPLWRPAQPDTLLATGERGLHLLTRPRSRDMVAALAEAQGQISRRSWAGGRGRPVLVGGHQGTPHCADSPTYPSVCPCTHALI